MTRKKAIKTIMSVTGHGDKRAASDTFDMVKKCIVGNPSNADVCFRALALIYNRASADPEPCFLHIQNHCAGVAVCKIAA
jgi:hypothetical protein